MPSKKIRVRLYADENFPIPSVTHLRSYGVSVIHAYDLGLTNKSDKTHIKQARKLQRTLITIDRDFLYYNEVTSRGSAGAIVVSTGSVTPEHINQICHKALPKISQNFAKGAFIKITMSKITRSENNKNSEIKY